RDLVTREAYDIVHVHTPVASFLARYALRGIRARRRVRVVYTAHGFHFHSGAPAYRNAAYKLLERTAGRWTDHLVVINREDYEAARALRIVPREHLECMPGIGVDRELLDPIRIGGASIAATRANLGLGRDDLLLLMIAEFTPCKRHADALAAFARLQDLQHVHLALAGD